LQRRVLSVCVPSAPQQQQLQQLLLLLLPQQ